MKRALVIVATGLLLAALFVPPAAADHLLCKVTWNGKCLEHIVLEEVGKVVDDPPGEDELHNLTNGLPGADDLPIPSQEDIDNATGPIPGADDLPIPSQEDIDNATSGLPGPDDLPLPDDPLNLTDSLPGLQEIQNITDGLPGADDLPSPGPDDLPAPDDLPDAGDLPDGPDDIPGIGIPPGIFPLPIPDPTEDWPAPPFTFPVGRCFGHRYDVVEQAICIAATPLITLDQIRDKLGI